MAVPNPSPATLDFAALRRTMVDCQLRTFDVTDQLVLGQFLDIPREKFLPPDLVSLAYSDVPLKLKISAPDETQRCLLPPMILGRLIQAAQVTPADKILDVAPGTGYSTAIFAGLGAEVVALESDPALSETIGANLAELGLSSRARAVTGALGAGVPAQAPFDLIFVNGAVEAQLESLFTQLKEGGRLLAIRVSTGPGSIRASHAVRFEKINGTISSRDLFDAGAPVLSSFRASIQFVF
jgi:protein-L-isoaspartate(D-aspartate) O-methyltransferase